MIIGDSGIQAYPGFQAPCSAVQEESMLEVLCFLLPVNGFCSLLPHLGKCSGVSFGPVGMQRL